MTRFAPVFLPPERRLERRLSQTFVRYYDRCPRSGYLYQLRKGEVQTPPMIRGTAFHLVCERATQAMIQQEESSVPGDVVKAIVNEVLSELAVPIKEHDVLREMSYRWAAEWTIDPANVLACETLLALDVDGWQLRCKVDFAEARAGGLLVHVVDYKTARAAVGFEEIARKRPDGSLVARQLQLILYALALAYGKPVRVEDSRETLEPFPLAAQAEQFDLELVFPGIEREDGTMVRRPVSLNRLELGEYMESLKGLLARIEHSERTGEWDAIISDEACSECPCKPECPIPNELRDHAGEINTLAEAAEAAEVLDRRSDQNTALRTEIKNWAKAHDTEIRYGKNKAWRFAYGESDRIDRKDEMFDAIQRSIDYGQPFDRSSFVRTVGSTSFKAVTLTEDELAEEAREREAAA